MEASNLNHPSLILDTHRQGKGGWEGRGAIFRVVLSCSQLPLNILVTQQLSLELQILCKCAAARPVP